MRVGGRVTEVYVHRSHHPATADPRPSRHVRTQDRAPRSRLYVYTHTSRRTSRDHPKSTLNPRVRYTKLTQVCVIIIRNSAKSDAGTAYYFHSECSSHVTIYFRICCVVAQTFSVKVIPVLPAVPATINKSFITVGQLGHTDFGVDEVRHRQVSKAQISELHVKTTRPGGSNSDFFANKLILSEDNHAPFLMTTLFLSENGASS